MMSADTTIDLPAIRWIDPDPETAMRGGPIERAYDAEAPRLLREQGGLAAVEAAAARYADRVAIDDGTLRLTYAEFIDRVYGLAGRLRAWPAGSVVMSLVHNSAASPIIIMATAMAGHVLVPIDATHPHDRQAAILAEAGAVALIIAAGDGADDSFVPVDLPRIEIDPREPTGAPRPATRYDPASPLFVVFTSGSTGRPKGVVSGGRYGGMALAQFIERYRLAPGDVMISLASLSVGGSRDAFVALASGALLRICDIRRGFGEIMRVLGEEQVTILSFIPNALRMILSVDGAEQAFRHLRILDLHGEKVLASDIALFREKLPTTCRISITMGSMEAGAVFSWFVEDGRIDGPVSPVGYLLPGRQISLLGEDGGPVSPGEVGELLVRGAMAMGAWRAGQMVPGPLLPDPDDATARIYPMGDLVRQREDGLFEYVGRKDRQVKINGLWAELGEVEAALRGMNGVADTVVLATRRSGEGDRLVAFITLQNGFEAPPLAVMRRTVAAETAEHMAPSELHVLPAIPRLANFKPDLIALEGHIAGR